MPAPRTLIRDLFTLTCERESQGVAGHLHSPDGGVISWMFGGELFAGATSGYLFRST